MTTIAAPSSLQARALGWRMLPEQRLLLQNVSWEAYLSIAAALSDRPYLRMTFDRGSLEFMTTSPQHEIYKKWLSRLIETLAEEYGTPWVSAGQMTFRKPELERGMEPDDCYWFAHEPQMRGRLDYDSSNDPPPDLLLEIEISRSALDRMSIFAAIGIPEVWRFDAEALHIHQLQADRTYVETPASAAFPGVQPVEMKPFLQPDPERDILSFLRAFRVWARQQRTSSNP